MTKSSTQSALARQWELLKMLPAKRPGITTIDLTMKLDMAGYRVSKRTVERDLNTLSLSSRL